VCKTTTAARGGRKAVRWEIKGSDAAISGARGGKGFASEATTDNQLQRRAEQTRASTGVISAAPLHSAHAGKMPENRRVELDNRSVHQRERSNKPDSQRKHGQAIFKADSSTLVLDETAKQGFHRTGPS
jgi:hypothetical protein